MEDMYHSYYVPSSLTSTSLETFGVYYVGSTEEVHEIAASNAQAREIAACNIAIQAGLDYDYDVTQPTKREIETHGETEAELRILQRYCKRATTGILRHGRALGEFYRAQRRSCRCTWIEVPILVLDIMNSIRVWTPFVRLIQYVAFTISMDSTLDAVQRLQHLTTDEVIERVIQGLSDIAEKDLYENVSEESLHAISQVRLLLELANGPRDHLQRSLQDENYTLLGSREVIAALIGIEGSDNYKETSDSDMLSTLQSSVAFSLCENLSLEAAGLRKLLQGHLTLHCPVLHLPVKLLDSYSHAELQSFTEYKQWVVKLAGSIQPTHISQQLFIIWHHREVSAYAGLNAWATGSDGQTFFKSLATNIQICQAPQHLILLQMTAYCYDQIIHPRGPREYTYKGPLHLESFDDILNHRGHDPDAMWRMLLALFRFLDGHQLLTKFAPLIRLSVPIPFSPFGFRDVLTETYWQQRLERNLDHQMAIEYTRRLRNDIVEDS